MSISHLSWVRSLALTVGVTVTLGAAVSHAADLTLTPQAVTGGETFSAVVTVQQPEGQRRGVEVELRSTDVALIPMLPKKVLVPWPDTELTVSGLPTRPVANDAQATLVLIDVFSASRASILIRAPRVLSLELPEEPLLAGASAEGAVLLSGAAPANGFVTKMTAHGPEAIVPPTLVLAPGESEVGFMIATAGVTARRDVNLSASAAGSSVTGTVTVLPSTLEGLELFNSTAFAGTLARGRVILSGPAGPGGAAVSLTGDAPAVRVPDQVLVEGGQADAGFEAGIDGVVGPTTATLTAKLADESRSVELRITPATLGSIAFAPSAMRGARSTRGRLALLGSAGAAAVTVTLSNSHPDLVTLPGELQVAPGEQLATFDAAVAEVGQLTTVKVTAETEHGDPVEADLRLLPPIGTRFSVQEISVERLPLPPRRPGYPPRLVAAATDVSGIPAHFVETELLIKADDRAELDRFLERWPGELVFDGRPPLGLPSSLTPSYVVRISGGSAAVENFEQNMERLQPDVGGELRFSSAAGLELFAVAAAAKAEGFRVNVNWIMEPFQVDTGTTIEAPAGSSPDAIWGQQDTYNPNSFQWLNFRTPMLSGWFEPQHGIDRAWSYLNRAGRDQARIPLAVIDGGFMFGDPDMPADRVALTTSGAALGQMETIGSNPWHGSNVTQTAAAVIDNSLGTAGTGGPVAQPITIQTGAGLSDIEQALELARANGARIVNMSFGSRIPAVATIFADELEDLTRQLHNQGIVLVAAAGNEGEDVDEEDCAANVCWEAAWHVPCENDGVICVGGLDYGSTWRDSRSNYGNEEVDIFAPYRVLRGARPPNNSQGLVAGSSTGTSYSSPYTAGVAALMIAADPSLTAPALNPMLIDAGWSSSDLYVRRYVNAGRAVHRALGDLPPEVEITVPVDGALVGLFESEFKATALDLEDGALQISWSSDRDGALGTGNAAFFNDLSPGSHTITASVTDSHGWTVEDSISVTKFNSPPSLEIVQPLAYELFFQGQQIAFRGQSFDLDHFQQGQLPDGNVGWFSSINAYLGGGHETTASLSPGTHTIWFSGFDLENEPAWAQRKVVVAPSQGNSPPSAWITTPPVNSVKISKGQSIVLSGAANDPEDGVLSGASLVWKSDQDGVLGTGTSITVTLSGVNHGVLVHRITLRATDSGGLKSQEMVLLVSVEAPVA